MSGGPYREAPPTVSDRWQCALCGIVELTTRLPSAAAALPAGWLRSEEGPVRVFCPACLQEARDRFAEERASFEAKVFALGDAIVPFDKAVEAAFPARPRRSRLYRQLARRRR